MITVRRARPAEYERVGALTLAAYRELPVDHLFGGYDEQILDTAGRSAHADILVAVTGEGEVVGAVTYVDDDTSEWSEWTQPGEVQFRLLAVDPRRPRLGAGTALVTECVRRADAERRPIVIHTTPWMEAAQRIYSRFGFARCPDRDATYEMWHEDPGLEVAPEWIGQPFLAYLRAPRR